MKIIICLDEQNGYMFGGRRQSMDSVLRQRIISKLDGKPLWMSEYTKKQFAEDGNFVVDNDYEKNAPDDDFCFIEDKGYNLQNCNEIWIFRWKRKYPFDKAFDENLEDLGFKRNSKLKFAGSSHETITFEVYKK